VSSEKPSVRIGMIQSAEQIQFDCPGPFSLLDMKGRLVAKGRARETCTVTIDSAQPSQIRYGVRLAIAEEEAEAAAREAELKKAGHSTRSWHVGLVQEIGGRTLDNRDYWLVTDPFADQAAAQAFAREYQPAGEAVVVKEIVAKSTGTLRLGDKVVKQGLRVVPEKPQDHIRLHGVTIGIEFHWQHQRTEELPGVLEIGFNNDGRLIAINELDIETYLISVNSSEMTKDNPIELLKAQTIAARSTILATMGKHHYDENFHICADDHCQCYHGVANISEASAQAARETEGENLLMAGRVCDARYAKICGGVMEDYRYVWDNRSVPYLVPGIDGKEQIPCPLEGEEAVKAYIDSSPDVWCNTSKYQIPSSLPYNTRDLFRWRVTYGRKELEALIKRKLADDFGDLIDLIPGERGPSGRLIDMQVVGSKKTLRVGKELQIRRILSESHLYSGCFYIEREKDAAGKVSLFHLVGAGWGHGVGLCQVGATVMAQEGFHYRDILAHYYKNSCLEKIY
jgi:stage II sporulation protein D